MACYNLARPKPRAAWERCPMSTGRTTRRSLLFLMVAAAVFLVPGRSDANGPAFVKKTYTYKTADGVPVQADCYRPDDAKVRPVVVWIHGGALIVGGRNSVPRPLQDLCRAEGYALVSLDYRLAPEVKLPAILDDVRDAFRWLR